MKGNCSWRESFFFENKNKCVDAKLISTSTVMEAMPSIKKIFDLTRTIAVSTATCESSFSSLKRILTPQRMSMLHARKADLVLISFGNKLAKKLQSDGDGLLLRRFWEAGNRQLPLY